jgi:solute:Na+ symporter, SSS family
MTYWILGSLAIYMALILVIGFRSGRQAHRDTESFFVADRNINWLQESMAVFTTIAPANALLGTVGLFYANGMNISGYLIGYVFVTPMIYWLVGTKLRRLGKLKGYQTQAVFVGDLFSSRLLYWLIAITGVMFMVPYFMTNAIAVGILLEQTTGFPFSAGAALFIIVSVSYCMHGGLRAVADTDIFHGVLLLIFFVVAVVVMIAAAGGITEVFSSQKAVVATDNPAALKTFFAWILFIGISPIVWPDRSLRMYAVRDESNLRRGVIVTGVLLCIGCLSYLVFGITGNIISPNIKNTDTTMPVIIGAAAAWLLPFFVVNAWGSGMSNFSAGMLSTANIIIKDIYEPLKRRTSPASEETPSAPIWIARAIMLALSCFTLLVCLGNPPFIWTLISITISFFLQLSPILVLGLYWRKSSRVGAIVSWMMGVALVVVWTFWLPSPYGLFPGLVALGANIVLYVAFSLLVPDDIATMKARNELLDLVESHPAQSNAKVRASADVGQLTTGQSPGS